MSKDLSQEEILELYRREDPEELYRRAEHLTRQNFGEEVFLRALVEFTNYCSCDCHYCGISRSNLGVNRYRLDEETLMSVIEKGLEKGMNTFVLQGGEDPKWPAKRIAKLVKEIRLRFGNEFALTLSCGLKSKEEYALMKEAGANRYLMRFETSDPELFKQYTGGKSLERRLQGLRDLHDMGWEVGSGYMTGLPGETEEIRINNALLCQQLGLHMLGIGPFIPHPDTPLKDAEQQPLEWALKGTALLRLLLPKANIPATTAAGTLDPRGREQMLQAGANVLMPNITPVVHKKDYLLYPGKICLDESGFECVGCLTLRCEGIDRELSFKRGDSPSFTGV
ncbi:MAG: [FeFe] hydrogenase H-cluster radical SAM maturase HydE [Spirochaetaceae bacterium]|nr:[FeFe] hydrogenase H-cluster radical SAM maturase HydE [Spirochaetaceae bacterium]